MTSIYGQQNAWSNDFNDHRNRFNRFNRLHGALTPNTAYALTHDDGGDTGNLDLVTWDGLQAGAPTRNDYNINGLVDKLGGPWAMSSSADGDANIWVAYTTSDTEVKLACVQANGTLVSEESVITMPPGYTAGLVDVDTSALNGNLDGVAVVVAVLAVKSPNQGKVFICFKDSTGTWITDPIELSIDSYNFNAGQTLVNENGGPLAIAVGNHGQDGPVGANTCCVHVMARAADYGKIELWEMCFDRGDADSHTPPSQISGNLAPSSVNTRDAYGSLFSSVASSATDHKRVMVGVATRQLLHFGEHESGVGWVTDGLSSTGLSLGGTWPTQGTAAPRSGQDDLRYIALVAGPDRIAFQVVRDLRYGSNNSSSYWNPVMVVHAKLETDDDGKQVLWHVNGGYTPRISTWSRTLNIFNGGNRFFEYGRMTYFFFYKELYFSSSMTGTLQMAFGWNQTPTASGAVAVPADSSTVDTDVPVLEADTLYTLKSGLDLMAEFHIGQGGSWTRSFTSRFQDASFIATPSGQLPDDQALTQGSWEAFYAELDTHGMQKAFADALATGTSEFDVVHVPTSSGHFPRDGYVVQTPSGSPPFTEVRFRWNFVDASPVDFQTAYELECEYVGGINKISTGKVVSASSEHISTTDLHDTDDLLRWRVRVWDRDDVMGSWSQWNEFYVAKPPEPSLTTPWGGTVATPKPLVEWSVSLGTFTTLDAFRLVILTQQDAIVYDTEWLEDGALIQHQVPNPVLTLGQTYKFKLQVRDEAGTVGEIIETATATWAQPPQADPVTIDTSEYQSKGFVKIEWDDSDIDPDFVAWSVYRRLVGAGDEWHLVGTTTVNTGPYEMLDVLAPANLESEYAVAQVIEFDGIEVESEIVTAEPVTPADDHYWLIDPAAQGVDSEATFDGLETSTLKLAHVTGEPFADEVEEEFIPLINRGRKKEVGTRWGYAGTLSATLRGLGGETPRVERFRLEAARLNGSEMWLRNPFGDTIKVSLGAISFTRESGVGTSEFLLVEIPYFEVT